MLNVDMSQYLNELTQGNRKSKNEIANESYVNHQSHNRNHSDHFLFFVFLQSDGFMAPK